MACTCKALLREFGAAWSQVQGLFYAYKAFIYARGGSHASRSTHWIPDPLTGVRCVGAHRRSTMPGLSALAELVGLFRPGQDVKPPLEV